MNRKFLEELGLEKEVIDKVMAEHGKTIQSIKPDDYDDIKAENKTLKDTVADLQKSMKDLGLKKPILPTVKEIIVANSTFEQGLFQQTIKHKGQPSLSQVVTNCDKRNIGSSGGFGYRSQIEENDISLMDSMILAHWACHDAKPVKKQKISY